MKTVVGITQAQIDKIKAIFYGEVEIEQSFIPETPVSRMAKKSVNEQYSDMVSAWAVQKKED